MLGLAEERGISIVGTGPGVMVVGVPSALRRAVSALADNAIAHTSSGGHVCVEVVREPATSATAEIAPQR